MADRDSGNRFRDFLLIAQQQFLNPDVAKLDLIVMPLQFDWPRRVFFVFAGPSLSLQNDIVMNQFTVLINRNSRGFGFLDPSKRAARKAMSKLCHSPAGLETNLSGFFIP